MNLFHRAANPLAGIFLDPGAFVLTFALTLDRGRMPEMNGAESLVRTLVAGGVNVCFANSGTSEMHFVAALDKLDGMRCVLCLFEGSATGAGSS